MNKLIATALTLSAVFLAAPIWAADGPAASSSKDAKMKTCLAQEKGKNNSKTEAEMQQTCMLRIAEAQGDPSAAGKDKSAAGKDKDPTATSPDPTATSPDK